MPAFLPGEVPQTTPLIDPSKAIRLTFEFNGEHVLLVERQSLTKTTPATDQRDTRDRSGFWLDLVDRQNRTLYRRVLVNPIATTVEAPAHDPDHPLSRVLIADSQGSFAVVLPDLPDSLSVVIFSSPADPRDPAGATKPAREVARFQLGDGWEEQA